MITVIDYGMGNSGSIMNILRRIGAEAVLTSDVDEIAKADKLILPGVGAFDRGMERLHALGLVGLLNQKVMVEHTPILGICLGMQLFAKASEEGAAEGLGWFDATSIRFKFGSSDVGLKIPHMGWNVLQCRRPNQVLGDLAGDARFYFVHSYHVQCRDPADILATCQYGREVTAAIARGSIIGVQFHPEKSLRWGMDVFRKFVHHDPRAATSNHSVPAAA